MRLNNIFLCKSIRDMPRRSGRACPYQAVFRSGMILLLLLATGVGFLWLLPHPSHTPRPRQVAQTPAFKPVVGDVSDPEDDDPDITVEQPLVPAFQFQRGGYALNGVAIDAQSRQPVLDAVVEIDLPVQEGQPTSIALHAVTDLAGSFRFAHLAAGSYMIVASRYYTMGRYYGERVFSPVILKGNRSGLILPLDPVTTPAQRSVGAGQAKNVILIDLRGFYASSLLDDPLLADSTRNLRTFLQRASVLRSLWQPYGWRPLDQYALLTGTYPQWATYDPWPHVVPWGMPDYVDTTFWFSGNRSMHIFGQESIFDVAKGYGMQTGAIAGADYILSDATTRNLDLLQRSSSFAAGTWLAQVEDTVLAGMQQSNGFLLYSQLAPLPAGAATSSPDARGDEYQQALLQADQTFGRLLTWLGQQGLLQNTLIALTTSQAQANHTDADNFYGMGITGQGTSKQTLLALSGPGVCPGKIDTTVYSSFLIAPVLMQALGLPAPSEARMPSPFQKGCL